MWPASTQHDLHRACLLSGEPARDAWRRWSGRHTTPRDALRSERGPGCKRFLGLLLISLKRNQVEPAPEWLTLLKSAHAAERIRYDFCRRIYADVMSLLRERGVPFIVLKGVALAHTVYEEPALRHCHDLDLLLKPADLPAAAEHLAKNGFRMARNDPGTSAAHLQLIHPSRLPISLHGNPLRGGAFDLPVDELWTRATPADIAGVNAPVFSPRDNLHHVCVQAFGLPGRYSWAWVSDAWSLLARNEAPDWDRFLGAVERSRTALPVHETLSYLAEGLGAPVPPAVCAQLGAWSLRADPISRAAIQFGSAVNATDCFLTLFRIPSGIASRRAIWKWFIWPDRAYIRWAYESGSRGPVFLLQCIHLARRMVGAIFAAICSVITLRRVSTS